MDFRLAISLPDHNATTYDVAACLERTAAQLRRNVEAEAGTIRDTNGNTVGLFEFGKMVTFSLSEVRNSTGWARGLRFAVVAQEQLTKEQADQPARQTDG